MCSRFWRVSGKEEGKGTDFDFYIEFLFRERRLILVGVVKDINGLRRFREVIFVRRVRS